MSGEGDKMEVEPVAAAAPPAVAPPKPPTEVFGFFQATGGPVGTAVMGNWFCDEQSVKNRGTIFGFWTCHQYCGDVTAALATSWILAVGLPYWYALLVPAITNALWAWLTLGLVADPYTVGIITPEVRLRLAKFEAKKKEMEERGEDAGEDEGPGAISYMEAIRLPMVAQYAIAFGFFKLTNYVLFFWLPFFLQSLYDDVTANLIASLYSVGMMPGGIIVGYVSDIFGGRRAVVIGVFMSLLIVCLAVFAKFSEARIQNLSIDITEAKFKLALSQKRYSEVMHMVRHSRLCGTSIVAYLQKKGFPEVALHFVREPQTRFKLALACGNIEAAMESAFSLEGRSAEGSGRDVWGVLGSQALRQGNHQVVEMSYQRTKDFDRLSFLYMITGDNDKLKKMLKIAQMRQDTMGRYHNALLLGNATERVKVLEETGNLNLAYISAKNHGLEEEAERLKVMIETNGGNVEGLMEKLPVTSSKSSGRLLQPPTAINRNDNWPLLPIQKTTLEDLQAAEAAYETHADAEEKEEEQKVDNAAWDSKEDDDDDDLFGDAGSVEGDFDLGDGEWGDDDEDFGGLDDFDTPVAPKDGMADLQNVSDDDTFQMPPAGRPPAACWATNSSHASDHLAAGGVSSALQLLNRQIAVTNFAVMKDPMMTCYLACTASLPGLSGGPSLSIPVLRNDASGHPGDKSLPKAPLSLQTLKLLLRQGYRAFQSGKFNDAKNTFGQILMTIPLVVTDSPDQTAQVKELLETSREYITAIRIKAAMSECMKDPVKSTELSAYFTHCNLQPLHLLLALRSAMGTAFKQKNFIVAASFARRLLELPDMSNPKNADLRVKATKVLQKSEQMARNEHTLNYDETKAFKIDCFSFEPLYNDASIKKCPYCGSAYSEASCGSLGGNKKCATCNMSTVGVNTIGLVSGS